MLKFLQEADTKPRLSVREVILMAVVADSPGRSTGALAAQLGVSRQVATRTTTTLVTRGYMSKLPDPQQRKLVRVTLTRRGRTRLDRLRAAHEAV